MPFSPWARTPIPRPIDLKTAAAVIVKLKSKKIVSDEDFARERDGYYRRRLAEAKNSRFGSFLLSKKDDYKIRFNAEIFEKIKEYRDLQIPLRR